MVGVAKEKPFPSMSRSVRAETRASKKDDVKKMMMSLEPVRHWEKKWVSINDSSMKIYKWVPISSNDKKKGGLKSISSLNSENKENSRTKTGLDSNSNSNFAIATEDSNTCFSMVSDSQGEFVSNLPFTDSENSNSQGSDAPTKRLKTDS